jgi:hypothetical protein
LGPGALKHERPRVAACALHRRCRPQLRRQVGPHWLQQRRRSPLRRGCRNRPRADRRAAPSGIVAKGHHFGGLLQHGVHLQYRRIRAAEAPHVRGRRLEAGSAVQLPRAAHSRYRARASASSLSKSSGRQIICCFMAAYLGGCSPEDSSHSLICEPIPAWRARRKRDSCTMRGGSDLASSRKRFASSARRSSRESV